MPKSQPKRRTEVEVPQRVASIYARLKTKYSAGFEEIEVKGEKFHILAPQDLEPFIAGRDIFKEAADFPFWVKIWEASVVLAQLMASLPPKRGQRIIEIGAGLGVTGLVASKFGHEVLLTDYEDEVLDFPRVSAQVNGCNTCLLETLDWLKPRDLGKFDIIIGSEILFHKKFFAPLLEIFRRFLKEDGVIYMAHDSRRQSLGAFLPMCEKDYSIGVKKIDMRGGDESFSIILTRLALRK